ncbi:glycosyltransferase family 2 protein [Endozoicomonas sp. SCSIO W0465]|uniref:glycosyltransferase family 2 protein n=1 Tax=Endozoicomonas sp. SCSIO W0465 TaxID=2918516 RepID=UPI002075D107|nr:glycosyltransferase family 2 protein [Endozoicomonas sp. SCSIO W0465]USE34515.1 glycosyltransferase family 2 protein [Endozoicomonas sp. SCSIO W0465]
MGQYSGLSPSSESSARTSTRQSGIALSVIIPFYNEEAVLSEFHRRLVPVLETLNETLDIVSEILYIDDGSCDRSFDIIQSFSPTVCDVLCIRLSRNFGKEAAMSAGLEHSSGAAVVLLDADLQDPPELIPSMLDTWRRGFDVVNMQRRKRQGERWLKRFSAAVYYRLLNAMAHSDIPENVGDFRLLDRQVVDHINQMPEKNRYMKGIFSWPGYRQTNVLFDRDPRFCGETKWNFFKLLGLAADGITSFSIRPLRLATVLGTLIALSAFFYGSAVIVKTLLFGEVVTGYPSLMVVQLGLGGIQLLSVGLLGEYIGRIFIETKGRPLYLTQDVTKKTAVVKRSALRSVARHVA